MLKPYRIFVVQEAGPYCADRYFTSFESAKAILERQGWLVTVDDELYPDRYLFSNRLHAATPTVGFYQSLETGE
jgi:hypothetical protein